MKVMYLDESGDHSLDKIDPSYPVFVLGGVILDRAYARTVVAPRLRQLKEDLFDDPNLILHRERRQGAPGLIPEGNADLLIIAFCGILSSDQREALLSRRNGFCTLPTDERALQRAILPLRKIVKVASCGAPWLCPVRRSGGVGFPMEAPKLGRLRSLRASSRIHPGVTDTADIVRAKNGFETLKDPTVRADFYEAINAMMRELDYKVVACVIKKDAHLAKYGTYATDPYHYSLDILVERFCKELGDTPDGGFICAEKRSLELDRALDQAWARLIREGTSSASAKRIDERIVDLGLKDKSLDIAGLQLADLVVSPIGRAVMGKPTHEDWEIVKGKFRRSGSRYLGYGLVIRP